ncbi:non-ribosomal peptide synthetase [Solihabitans fulvus]|uniref:Non-ribosomal peptide synthetase n=1 Tax=Solihabitans fulvus TaxID=1892852 RepID=A0A5B2WW15_9PSEU|nr:non-ribosomal peptide synthetase [Solihabitans fulvus]KAA2254639.1 non-ribosomal peptide synthetase [Solihabitans fulvus]
MGTADDGTVTTVYDRFADIARTTPEATAVVFGDERLSYGDLSARADEIAGHLAAEGVRAGDLVGVLLDRSAHLIASLLAVLRVRAAYVALDPRDPPERIAALLADAGVRVALTERAHRDLVGGDVIALLAPELDSAPTGDLPVRQGDPADLAYLAYTSGSTGTPKGVCVPHRAIVRLVLGQELVAARRTDVFLQYAPVAFDASTLEIWGPLLNGGTLVVAPPGELGPAELVELVRRERVTVLWLTAGLFHQVVDEGLTDLPALRRLIAGGDVLSAAHVDRAVAALPDCVVVNGYGPTENTTFTCWHPVRAPLAGRDVPIGLPVNGTEVYLLDDDLRPVADGTVGTLHAAGAGLARGYLNRPSLTAQRFLPNPFATSRGALMYDTGDLARWHDGVLEFVGRADGQVKVRGYRVEPGEVEAALRGLADVRNAVVVAQDHSVGGRRLAAFYESEFAIPSSELRRSLSATLPGYLVPATFTWLESLPLTAVGKADRAALAARRNRQRPDIGSDYRAPTTRLESWLAGLWQEVMEIDPVGVDDDFFELGGHSLLATRVTSEIASEFDVFVRARTFYENPTIAELAVQVAALADAPAADVEEARA